MEWSNLLQSRHCGYFLFTGPLLSANFNDLRSMFIAKKCGKSNIAEGEANLGLTHKCFCIFVTKSSDGLLLAFPTNALFFSSFRIWPQLWATQKKTNVFAFYIASNFFFLLGCDRRTPPPIAEKFPSCTNYTALWALE